MAFGEEFEGFYETCLTELKSRENFSESWLPQLERYVTITATLAKLNSELVNESMTVKHTNKAEKTNEVSSPKWRMFICLNKEANALAKELGLTPSTAPKSSKKEKVKGFELGMRVAK